jgi:hypothetical protein
MATDAARGDPRSLRRSKNRTWLLPWQVWTTTRLVGVFLAGTLTVQWMLYDVALDLLGDQDDPLGMQRTLSDTAVLPKRRNITLIVETKGELGNHLNAIAHGLRIKHWVESEYPHLTVLLQAEHRDDHKWLAVAPVLQQCFPVLRQSMELWQGGTWMNESIPTDGYTRYQRRRRPEPPRKWWKDLQNWAFTPASPLSRYQDMQQRQEAWLQQHGQAPLVMDVPGAPTVSDPNVTHWRSRLDLVLKMHAEQERVAKQWWWPFHSGTLLAPEPAYPAQAPPLQYVSLPFLRTASWSFHVPFTGSYYELVRTWLAMNETDPACCRPTQPDPDEIVWHYRNFKGESEDLVSRGFVEVDPSQAVQHIFQPLAHDNSTNVSTKIAMLSRFPQDLEPFEQALQNSPVPFQTRRLYNGTAATDFCFLRQTQRLLIGVHLSSYAGWAAFLGRASSVLLYVVNNTATRQRADRRQQSFFNSLGRIEWLRHDARFHLRIVPDPNSTTDVARTLDVPE